MPRLTQRQLTRAHAELVEHGIVHMESPKDAAALAAQLPSEGRPYFVRGRRLKLGTSKRELRVERIGSRPPHVE